MMQWVKYQVKSVNSGYLFVGFFNKSIILTIYLFHTFEGVVNGKKLRYLKSFILLSNYL